MEIMSQECVEAAITLVNEILDDIRRSGRAVEAKGKYLYLEDILEIELSNKKIE